MNLTRDLRSAKAKPSGNTVWFRNKTRESQTELDGIVGGGSVFAVIYSILNAVRNKTLNSKVLSILRERATPMTEQEISSLLEIPLARLQRRIDSRSSSPASYSPLLAVWAFDLVAYYALC